MNSVLSTRVLVALSVLYGIVLAILGALDLAVTPVAIVGAFVVGGLWALRGILTNRNRDDDHTSRP